MTMWLDRWFENLDSLRWLSLANLLFYLCAFVMVASLTLGGGARNGRLSEAILQLVAIPLLVVALWKLFEVPLTKQTRVALLFCFAIAVLPFVQLIPLPPWLWTALPNRQLSAEAFDLTGQAVPWMPISVSPHRTWLSALSLLTPLAIFIGTLLLGYRERRWLSLVVLAVGVLGAFIGLIQVGQGAESPLRFFHLPNDPTDTSAVGFFSNRNHFAAFLYALTLLAAAWTSHAAAAAEVGRNWKQNGMASILVAIGCFTLIVVLLAAQAMARSRAGLGLTIVALFGAFALAFCDRRAGTSGTRSKLLLGAITLAVILAAQFALYGILERFAGDPLEDSRLSFVSHTIEAAKAYMPLGSGLGSFVPVYALFEQPGGTTAFEQPAGTIAINTYVNRAHNDALELWLETGVFGLVLMGLFAIWFAARSVMFWRSAPLVGREIDGSLVRAATIIIALVMIHSLVDFPLRTGGMMAIMAFACALLIEPCVAAEDVLKPQALRKSTRYRGVRTLEPSPSPVLSRRSSARRASEELSEVPSTGGRWGADIQWPDEWRKPSEPGPTNHSPIPPKSHP